MAVTVIPALTSNIMWLLLLLGIMHNALQITHNCYPRCDILYSGLLKNSIQKLHYWFLILAYISLCTTDCLLHTLYLFLYPILIHCKSLSIYRIDVNSDCKTALLCNHCNIWQRIICMCITAIIAITNTCVDIPVLLYACIGGFVHLGWADE